MCAVIGHSELRTVYTSLPTIIRVTVKALRFSLLFYQFYVRGSYSLLAARCVIHLGCRLIAQMFFFGKYHIQSNQMLLRYQSDASSFLASRPLAECLEIWDIAGFNRLGVILVGKIRNFFLVLQIVCQKKNLLDSNNSLVMRSQIKSQIINLQYYMKISIYIKCHMISSFAGPLFIAHKNLFALWKTIRMRHPLHSCIVSTITLFVVVDVQILNS